MAIYIYTYILYYYAVSRLLGSVGASLTGGGGGGLGPCYKRWEGGVEVG